MQRKRTKGQRLVTAALVTAFGMCSSRLGGRRKPVDRQTRTDVTTRLRLHIDSGAYFLGAPIGNGTSSEAEGVEWICFRNLFEVSGAPSASELNASISFHDLMSRVE
jgi:hypothetical protein